MSASITCGLDVIKYSIPLNSTHDGVCQSLNLQSYLGTSQFLHHKERIISSFIVIVLIIWGGSSLGSLPQEAATSSRVKRIYHNGLSTFNFTSAERTALAF